MTVEPRIAYDDAKSLAAHRDARVRLDLARRTDVQPEILFYLAGDSDSAVRQAIAENATTPVHADLALARDGDVDVRCRVADKVARLVPRLDQAESERVGAIVVEVLETLARDALPEVRRVLSESLKEVANAPESVIHRLARDPDLDVAIPVLEHSPLLGDDVLVEIIESGAVREALSAIARRNGLGVGVSDAIVARDDETAIATLLGNKSAQIREETLDLLVERAEGRPSWHEPLVTRPKLSAKAAGRLTAFVADSLVESLQRRRDLDPTTARAVKEAVRTRLERKGDPDWATAVSAGPSEAEGSLRRATAMEQAGELTDEAIFAALARGNRAFVIAAISVKSGVGVEVVQKIVSLASAKGMVSIAWKAGLDMRQAVQLQTQLARIPPSSTLRPRAGEGWPLSPDDMRWQLEFFGA